MIGEEAFYGDQSITNLELPEGLLRIESKAFADTSLQSVVLPRSLQYFAVDSFAGCPENLVICVYKDTKAQELCEKYGIIYQIIDDDSELVKAARAEGELVIYGSCSEDYLMAAAKVFSEKYDIRVQYQRLSSGEIPVRLKEEKGNPTADVWFCGSRESIKGAALSGLLDNSYTPRNAANLKSFFYKDPQGYWYGVYTGVVGFFVNQPELEKLGLQTPTTWDDLLKPGFKNLIWFANYNTAGMPKLVANYMIQKRGHDAGIQYLKDLDENIQIYTKAGSGPAKNVGTGECTVGIGFVHDALFQIMDNGFDNIKIVIPSDGTACDTWSAAMIKGAAHPNAARLFMEFALSPECANLALQKGTYQFPVINNTNFTAETGLTLDHVWEGYDFDVAARDTEKNINDIMTALGGGDERFRTE